MPLTMTGGDTHEAMTEAAAGAEAAAAGDADADADADIVLRAEDLAKTFRLGFFRRRVDAVRGVSFSVRRGEIFGFLGPNGAGKTTTLKMLMGLIAPTRGHARMLGSPVPSRAARRGLGYLPETPYFYEYLTPEEFLDFAGALSDVPGPERRRRATALIARVGLNHARGRALRKFSKGMLQRIGIAQALMGDPELVILDEPMTGLDPLGRKEVRDLILELRHQGKTVVFSTHILPDVETTCDRVAIVVGGRLRSVGAIGSLLSTRLLSTEVVIQPAPTTGPLGPTGAAAALPALPPGTRLLTTAGTATATAGTAAAAERHIALELPSDARVDLFLSAVLKQGGSIVSVSPRRESLEDLFVREAGARETGASPA